MTKAKCQPSKNAYTKETIAVDRKFKKSGQFQLNAVSILAHCIEAFEEIS